MKVFYVLSWGEMISGFKTISGEILTVELIARFWQLRLNSREYYPFYWAWSGNRAEVKEAFEKLRGWSYDFLSHPNRILVKNIAPSQKLAIASSENFELVIFEVDQWFFED